MTPQRVTLITLGVRDLKRAQAFYDALGWTPTRPQEGVVFYQMHGVVLALFGLADLAEDQGRAGATLGSRKATPRTLNVLLAVVLLIAGAKLVLS